MPPKRRTRSGSWAAVKAGTRSRASAWAMTCERSCVPEADAGESVRDDREARGVREPRDSRSEARHVQRPADDEATVGLADPPTELPQHDVFEDASTSQDRRRGGVGRRRRPWRPRPPPRPPTAQQGHRTAPAAPDRAGSGGRVRPVPALPAPPPGGRRRARGSRPRRPPRGPAAPRTTSRTAHTGGPGRWPGARRGRAAPPADRP